MNPRTYYIIIVLAFEIRWFISSSDSPPLSGALEDVLKDTSFMSYLNLILDDDVIPIVPKTVCSKLRGKKLLGCCNPVYYMEDVMIDEGKMFLFNKYNRAPQLTLPSLNFYASGSKWEYDIPLSYKAESFSHLKCKSYFNGTLHINGRKSIHKLFHALNDNLLPLMAEIVTDALLAPEYATLPRMSLIYSSFLPLIPERMKSRVDRFDPKNKLPHLELYRLLLTGEVYLHKLKRACFRRVAWGTGLQMHYVDAMVTLRRLTSDFARALVLRAFHLHTPPPFTLTSDPRIVRRAVHDTQLLRRDGRPLRVLLISRGRSGKGRSLLGEEKIIDKLHAAGALVASYYNATHPSLLAQLSLSTHADVAIGLHGAGLINAIFAPRGCIIVELKTIYGYTSDLFLHTTDARRGILVHIDIRDYSSPRKTHRVDDSLAIRIVDAIAAALKMQREEAGGEGTLRLVTDGGVDYLIGPAAVGGPGPLSSLLGPQIEELNSTCSQSLVFSKYRRQILGDDSEDKCRGCVL